MDVGIWGSKYQVSIHFIKDFSKTQYLWLHLSVERWLLYQEHASWEEFSCYLWEFYNCECYSKSQLTLLYWIYTTEYFFKKWICLRVIFALKKKPQKLYLHKGKQVKLIYCVTHIFQFFFVGRRERKESGRLVAFLGFSSWVFSGRPALTVTHEYIHVAY